MTDTNYTPDEIRLLDEFAAAYLTGSHYNPWHQGSDPDRRAEVSYAAAAAMIAERRKRIGKQLVTYRGIPVMEENPMSTATAGTTPVAQPEQAGELTEEAIADWNDHARISTVPDTGRKFYEVSGDEIDRAVAIMREGLRAKKMRDCWFVEHNKQQERAQKAEQERDEARAELDAYKFRHAKVTDELRARAEKAEAALAEAQPVLDAVALNFDKPYEKWIADHNRVLQAYADRRRAEKGSS